ncbi:collagen-binding domain-containing protein [Demequina sediminicola]|uniref:collagen-binding domain-containing protein n=1 Tax=Demequina sediminicola TaxID=1095026 RepID=UPI000783E22B|nr:collagen-binding domain-containing protein [Demequina sediminicola]
MSARTTVRVAAATIVTSAAAIVSVPFAAVPAAGVVSGPFAAAAGFTVVSATDVVVANHEIEGSIAAGGNLIADTQAFNIVHQAAGSGDYTLPLLDGEYVRVVAGGTFDREASTGSIRVSPRQSDPAKQGQVRLGSLDGLEVGSRGNGVCVREVGRNGCPFGDSVLEQSDTPQSVESVEDPHAYGALIAANAFEQFAVWSEAMAAGTLAGAYFVDLPDVTHPLNGVPLELEEGAANVLDIDADQLPATGWKIRFDGVAPSVDSPLVINVRANDGASIDLPTEAIGAYPQSSAHNVFAPYIVWNLVTEPGAVIHVNSPGIVPGSILAPQATVITGPQKTLVEGQIVAHRVELRNDGEIHHYEFEGLLALADAGTVPTHTDASAGAPMEEAAAADEDAILDTAPATHSPSPTAVPVPTVEPEVVPSIEPSSEPIVAVSDGEQAAGTPALVGEESMLPETVTDMIAGAIDDSPVVTEIADQVAPGASQLAGDSEPSEDDQNVPSAAPGEPSTAPGDGATSAEESVLVAGPDTGLESGSDVVSDPVIEQIVAIVDGSASVDQLVDDVLTEAEGVSTAPLLDPAGAVSEAVQQEVVAQVVDEVAEHATDAVEVGDAKKMDPQVGGMAGITRTVGESQVLDSGGLNADQPGAESDGAATSHSQARLAATGGVVDWHVGAALALMLAGFILVRRSRRS